MPARYLRHLAIERQPQTYALTVAAATQTAVVALKQAQKPLTASTVTVAAVALLKAKMVALQASTVVAGQLVKSVSTTRSAATHVAGAVGRLVALVRRAAVSLVGGLLFGASPAVVTVTNCPATFVTVTDGPL